jgi:hypothetical protein
MLMGLLVESRHNPASVLKDFFRSPGIVSLLVDSIRTPSGVYLEYTWSLTKGKVICSTMNIYTQSVCIYVNGKN